MESYLQVVVGPYELLIPADQVHEVRDYDVGSCEGGFTVWRDRILPTVSMRRGFALPELDTGMLIIRGMGGQVAECLVVDRVVGLLRLPESDFSPLPPVAGPSSECFDKVWTATNGHHALRLRGFGGRGAWSGSTLAH